MSTALLKYDAVLRLNKICPTPEVWSSLCWSPMSGPKPKTQWVMEFKIIKILKEFSWCIFFHFLIKIVWFLKGFFALYLPRYYFFREIIFTIFVKMISRKNQMHFLQFFLAQLYTTRGLQGFKSLTKLNLNVNRYMCCFHHHNC